MLTSNITNRLKKFRKPPREDWMWYEDPYKAGLDEGWRQGTIESHGGSVPPPNPAFGMEPPYIPVPRFSPDKAQ